MYATDFEYADKRLSDFNCVTCYIGNSGGVSEADIGCDITFQTIKNNHSSIQYRTASSYDSVYTTSFEIMKKHCSNNPDDLYMTYEEVSVLTKWLNRHEHRKFKVFSDSDVMPDVHYYGSFNVKEKTINDRIAGLILTFTGNAPYGFGETIRNEFSFIHENSSFSIHGDSDELGTIYPIVTIIPKVSCIGSACEIENKTTKSKVVIRNVIAGEIITLDGEHKIISTNNSEHTTLYNDFEYEWLDILIDDNFCVNEYTVNIPCDISIEYKPIRKVGVC